MMADPSDITLSLAPPRPLISPANAATSPSLLARARAALRGALLPPLLRALVSKKKRRFLDAGTGLDLDLAYISDRLLATGYPAVGVEALYRNPAASLRALLAARHGLAACRAWNLCIERGYAPERVGCAVVRQALTWYDHTPPPLAYLRPLCEDLQAWVDQGSANVAVVRASQRRAR